MPKGFLPTEDTGQIFAFTEAAQDISFEAMAEKQRAAAAIVRQQPNVDQLMSSIGAAAINVVPNTGRIFMRLKPRAERPPADEIIDELRPKLAAIPGHPGVSAEPADHPHRRPAHQGALPVHAPGDRSPRALPVGADRLRARCATLPGFQDVTTRSADHEPAGDGRHRPRQGLGPRRHRRADRERALQRLRLAPGLDDLRADQPVLGDPGARAARTSATRPTLSLLYVRSQQRASWCRSTRWRGSPPTIGPLTINHLGQLPSVTISFNLAPGVAARRGRRAGQRAPSASSECRPRVIGSFQGTAQAFQASLQGPGRAPAGRGPGDLHRAGHPLRELHPPAHDPLGPAVGGLRRAAHADALRRGAEHLRVRRHHHAGRHRQEERDHDDRLRARGPARRRQRRPTPSTRAACSASGRS